jgi:hypothetical protein
MLENEFNQKIEIVRQKVASRQVLKDEEKLLWLATQLMEKSLPKERGYQAPQ